MPDTLTKKQRSYCMSRIRSNNTKPEIAFRKYVWGGGIRDYRIKNKAIGKPDLYFPKKKIAVFIDGCFWHKCPRCFKKPKSNCIYWNKKIRNNVNRDKKVNTILKKEGVRVLRFWEHEIKNNIYMCYNRFKRAYGKTEIKCN